MTKEWGYVTDVLVVGCGGGGMTAALLARDGGHGTLVIEKGAAYGGSTAMSGGCIWIPNNHLMKKAGQSDSAEEGLEYLRGITGGKIPEARMRAYVKFGPEMVEYLERHTRVSFTMVRRQCDYYQNVKGAKTQGRSLEAIPFDIRKLDGNFGPMREHRLLPRISLSVNEAVGMLDSSLWGRLRAARVFAAYYLNPARSRGKGDTRLTTGNALVGRLRLSLAYRNVPVWLETSARRLIFEDGRVVGLEASKSGGTINVKANKAIILAAGGFAHNQEMRDKYQRQPVSESWSVACKDDNGDALRMGAEVGAGLDFMDDAWWASISMVPGRSKGYVAIIERNLPGSIMVNALGKRFTNEAAPYCDVVKAQFENHWQGQHAIPAHLIMDSAFRSRYLTGPMMPGKTPKSLIEKGYIKVSDTLEGLAEKCGIDPEGLAAEVKEFNLHAAKGRDPEFGRGESLLDRFYGDPSVRPNPCIKPISRPPFYAVQMWPGDIGTKGGLKTDARARVLREDGSVIQGLYAVGNCSSPVMGASYGGGGATIGSSMVFGYVAALDISGR